MARLPWRRTLHLLQQQQRSLLPPLAATSRSSPVVLSLRTASWALSAREAHFTSRDRFSGGCTQVCGTRIGDNRGMANGRRSFHATGIQHMAEQNFSETSGLQKGASAKEVEDAYYEMVIQRDSDVNKAFADAEKKCQEILQAYEILKDDAEKRALHDLIFRKGVAGGPGGFLELFDGCTVSLCMSQVFIWYCILHYNHNLPC